MSDSQSIFNKNPFDQLDAKLLEELNLLAAPYAFAYLISKGITSDFIEKLCPGKGKDIQDLIDKSRV